MSERIQGHSNETKRVKTRKGSARAANRTSRLLDMDILPEHDTLALDSPTLLPYDQDIPYEDQVEATPTPPSLADRIGRTKVYLLSESNVSRGSKVRVWQYH